MKRLVIIFDGPYSIRVAEEHLPEPAPNQVMVQTILTAISPGTEMLVYRGQWPENLPVDETIPALGGKFTYPLKYGYSAVGRVTAVGSKTLDDWLGKLVFSFNPHESHFIAVPEGLILLPSSLQPEEAAFLPNMETAVSFLMDGRPMIGENVTVFGQGVVGLLTTALLAKLPLGRLVTFDGYLLRREYSLRMGASVSLDPFETGTSGKAWESDLSYELSGNPAALDHAIGVTGFGGRIVIGSWYGGKRADVDLGGRFHRARIHILSSQVSNLAPELTGRWTKGRRLHTAMKMIESVKPSALITHRISASVAGEAYSLLDRHPDEAIQVILTYEDI